RTREIETVTLVHQGFEHLPPGEVRYCRTPGEEEVGFRDLAASADATLVIAPETSGVLLQRVQWVVNVGGRLLGPGVCGTHLTGDKVELARRWQKRQVPTPALRQLDGPLNFPAVFKPRHGAGSQATFLIRDAAEMQQALGQTYREPMVLQDYVPGQAASVSFLLYHHMRRVTLPPAAQHLSADGRFSYQGGTVPLPAPLAARAVALARRALDAVTDLHGYVGVDLVLGDASDGSA